MSAIRGVPVSARTAPVATSATRISLRSRSWRGVKHERDGRAVGRDGGAPLVAVVLEPAVSPERTSGCGHGIGDIDHREPRRVLALDRDDEPVVAEPHRAPASASFRGGPPAAATTQTLPWSA